MNSTCQLLKIWTFHLWNWGKKSVSCVCSMMSTQKTAAQCTAAICVLRGTNTWNLHTSVECTTKMILKKLLMMNLPVLIGWQCDPISYLYLLIPRVIALPCVLLWQCKCIECKFLSLKDVFGWFNSTYWVFLSLSHHGCRRAQNRL